VGLPEEIRMSATATDTSVQELDEKVNQAVLTGKAMEAF
jgi:hypothetical protein